MDFQQEEMSSQEFLRIFEELALSPQKHKWNDGLIHHYEENYDNDQFAQMFSPMIDITKKFIAQKCPNLMVSHKALKDQGDIFLIVVSILNSGFYQLSDQKDKKTLFDKTLQMIQIYAEQPLLENSIGQHLVESCFKVITCAQELLNDKKCLESIVPITKLVVSNSDKMPQVTNQTIQQIFTNVSNMHKRLFDENAEEFYMMAIKTKNLELLMGMQQNCKRLRLRFPETYEIFIPLYKELQPHMKMTLGIFIEEISFLCPEKLIKDIDMVIDDLDLAMKMYTINAIKNLCQIDAETCFKYLKDIQFVGDDAFNGYLMIEAVGAIGQNLQKEDQIKTCIDVLVQYESSCKDDWKVYLGLALKAIAHGGETHKKILKDQYKATYLDKWASGSDAKLSEQIKQLDDILHGRSLEKLDKKIDRVKEEVKKEVLEIVDKKLETFKEELGIIKENFPLPCDFEIRKTINDAIFLYYRCQLQSNPQCCRFSGLTSELFFKTYGKEVYLWLKVARTVFSQGKSLYEGNIDVAMGYLSGMYSLVSPSIKGDKTFEQFLEEPVLTSQEYDILKNSLKLSNFYQNFTLDEATNQWVCIGCKPIPKQVLAVPEPAPQDEEPQQSNRSNLPQSKRQKSKEQEKQEKRDQSACCTIF